MDEKMTHQGIYVSPDNVIPNRDREESKTNLILNKSEIVDKLNKAKDISQYLITIEPLVENVLKLTTLEETIQLALNYINNLEEE